MPNSVVFALSHGGRAPIGALSFRTDQYCLTEVIRGCRTAETASLVSASFCALVASAHSMTIAPARRAPVGATYW